MDTQKSNETRSTGSASVGSPGSSQLGSQGSASGSTAGSQGSLSSSTASGTGTSTGTGVNTGDMHRAIDKAADAAQPMVDKLATSAHQGLDKAVKTFDEKSRQLSQAYGQFMDSGRDYVRTRPMTSIAVAAGAGYLLAKLLSSRRSSL